MPSTVEQIKAKLNIVEVVGAYLKLEKAGINYKARCPFHQERTPSFFVSPTRQSFYCFGCNQGGDMFNFVETVEGLDFLGALKVLAERAGVPLIKDNLPRDNNKERLYQALAEAAEFYRRQLTSHPPALAYLRQRGLRDETISDFSLGFAPPEWQVLFNLLKERGYLIADLAQAGLIIQSTKQPGRWYDRFRGRIMFPIMDGSGRVIGFSARIFAQATSAEAAEVAKYINSPQTPLYDKSRVLYGYHRAKLPIRQNDYCVLVEGQMDLLLSHQAGVANAVAVSGTALTPLHLELLGRLTRNLVMAFDADAAGLKAAKRAIGLGLGAGWEVKIAALPGGVDPAEVILADSAAWPKLINEAVHAVDFLLNRAASQSADRRTLAHELKREAYPLIAALPERIDQAHFIAKVASLTGLAEELIRADLSEIKIPAEAKPPESRGFASAMTRRERIEAKLFGLSWWQPEAMGERLTQLLAADFPNREAKWQARKDELILEAELSYQNMAALALETETSQLLSEWSRETIKERVRETMFKLAAAERAGNHVLVEQYLNEIKNFYAQEKPKN